jgi:cysteine desulfurase
MREPIYLDNAATTAVDPAVTAEMCACMDVAGAFANASSTHAYGRAARDLVEQARQRVAQRIGAPPESIVFTSGATESNNWALRGLLEGRRGHLITARTEHESILDTARALARGANRVTYLTCDAEGLIAPSDVETAIGEDSALVSIMHVNNETGVIQDVAAIAERAHARGLLMHVDAAQSVGKLAVDVMAWGADLVSLTAHKSHGPKGIGALYLRPGVAIAPLLHGGEQQRGLRAGTLATHQIAGMGMAYELADPAREGPRLRALSERLRAGLGRIGGVVFNGRAECCAPHIVNAAFPGVEGESLRFALEDLAVSAGSACASASSEASHVLTSMGLGEALAGASLRFSVGRYTTAAEIDRAVDRVAAEWARLRAIAGGAPRWCSA